MKHPRELLTLKNKIGLYRQKRKLTQSELAEKVGCSKWTIVAIEIGAMKIPNDNIVLGLCKALKAKISDLWYL